MKEYFRKPWLSKSYHEMMSKNSNAAVWVQIKSKHSEMEKPYRHSAGQYAEMQHYFPNLPGLPGIPSFSLSGVKFDDMRFDHPWMGRPVDDASKMGISWGEPVCSDNPSIACYRPNQTNCWVADCAFHVIGVGAKSGWGWGGPAKCKDIKVYWDRRKICVKTGEDPGDDCVITITVLGEDGDTGTINVGKCPSPYACAYLVWDYGTSAETIDQNNFVTIAVKADPPQDDPSMYLLKWAVSGIGFSLENVTTQGFTNTLYADETACGLATITVTDYCGTSITGYVRGTTGQWVFKSNTCGLGGVAGTVYDYRYFTRFKVRAIRDNKKQENQYNFDEIIVEREARDGTYAEVCLGSSPCDVWIAKNCAGGNSQCLDYTASCEGLHGEGDEWCSQDDFICHSPCGCGWNGSQYEWRMDFYRYTTPAGAYLKYFEWEC